MKKTKVYENELNRRIRKLKKAGETRTAKEIEKRLWRFRMRNPIKRFSAEFQENCLRKQVIYEFFWCMRQGQVQCEIVFEDMLGTEGVSSEAMKLLDRLNPLHQT